MEILDPKFLDVKEQLSRALFYLKRLKNEGGERVTPSDRFLKFLRRIDKIVDFLQYQDNNYTFGPFQVSLDSGIWVRQLGDLSKLILVEKGVRVSTDLVVRFRQKLSGIAPAFVEELEMLLLKSTFAPANVTPVEITPSPIHKKAPSFPRPQINVQSVQLLLALEGEYGDTYHYPFTTSYVFDKEYGLAENHVTGFSKSAPYKTRWRLGDNICAPTEPVLNELLFAADVLAHIFRIPEQPSCTMNFSLENITDILSGKDTSIGYPPFELYSVTPELHRKGVHAKKKDVAPQVYRYIKGYLELKQRQINGESVEAPDLLSIRVECEKYESIVQDLLSGKQKPDDAQKALDKVRLFYIANPVDYVFDYVIGKPFSMVYRYFLSAIGIRVEDGGLQSLWDILSGCGTSPMAKEWEAKANQVWEEFGVDLTDRQYGMGDFSGYDQTLLAQNLGIVASMAAAFFEESDDISPELQRFLMMEFIKRMVIKLMYMYGLDIHCWVFGTMFSGDFLTSNGNTLYLMLILVSYLVRLLKKYPGDKILEIIIGSWMIIYAFYGDDHLGGWPRYANRYKLYDDSENCLHDFVNFCIRVFGMRYKWAEYAVFDDVYSVHQFETLDNGVVIETHSRPGPTFLRNEVGHIYLDGIYLGAYPYRATSQIIAKLGFSLTAVKNPHMHMCLLASLARLSSGNLEAFSQIRVTYEKFLGVYGEPNEEIWRTFFSTKQSNSFRNIIKDQLVGFPDINELHMRQNEGYERDIGFPALNSHGTTVDGKAYYDTGFPFMEFIQSRHTSVWESDDSD